MNDENYLELRLDEFLGRIAAGEQAPGGGSGAAYTVAVAAGLVAMVARCSRDAWGDARGVAAQALSIQERVAPLASVDARAWEEANEALRKAAQGTPARVTRATSNGSSRKPPQCRSRSPSWERTWPSWR